MKKKLNVPNSAAPALALFLRAYNLGDMFFVAPLQRHQGWVEKVFSPKRPLGLAKVFKIDEAKDTITFHPLLGQDAVDTSYSFAEVEDMLIGGKIRALVQLRVPNKDALWELEGRHLTHSVPSEYAMIDKFTYSGPGTDLDIMVKMERLASVLAVTPAWRDQPENPRY